MRSNREGQAQILLALADVSYATALAGFLEPYGGNLERCHDVQGVLRLTGRRNFNVVVLEVALGAEGGVDLVSFILQRNPQTCIILLFDVAQMDRALDGVRQGAFFYLPITCPPSDVAMAVDKALRSRAAQAAVDRYEQTVFEELTGSTPAMQRVIELIRKVAPTDSTVLLLGESGTGKEVLANTLHRLSRRQGRPFVAVNCAALPEGLLESELFGHVKGAFTGAEGDKRGLFEEADGGTIFLDEIGDMSPITQAKVLRVLQSGEFRRVGSSSIQHADVRVLAATNRDLTEAVHQNQFREDLYYRLNVIQIRIPPLRERMDALPPLLQHFIQRYNGKYGKNVRGVDDHAMGLLRHYEFPGNVRELDSIAAHAVIMADGPYIGAADLPDPVRFGVRPRLALGYRSSEEFMTLDGMEESHIRMALERFNGNQSVAAKKLGISRSTLWRKMNEYGIERGNEGDGSQSK